MIAFIIDCRCVNTVIDTQILDDNLTFIKSLILLVIVIITIDEYGVGDLKFSHYYISEISDRGKPPLIDFASNFTITERRKIVSCLFLCVGVCQNIVSFIR